MTKILVINGWTKDGDQQHKDAKCILQKDIFANIIKIALPNSEVTILDTYPEKNDYNLNNFDAFMWSGGGGNIYEINDHNNSQLNFCKKIIEKNKPIWGSCWGMQVIVTAMGGNVIKCETPEFGLSKDIEIINSKLNNSIYKGKGKIFDAPAHHFDIIEKIPSGFEIVSKNSICIQSIYSSARNIFCTQYHSELPYDYIANLMIFWRNNYTAYFTEDEFDKKILSLKKKEEEDLGNRLIEINNWLSQFD